jgi:hypothetical protein
MSIENLNDESILRLYENIRQQVSVDITNGRYRFLGELAKQRAETLRREIDRRRLNASRIEWT